MARQKTTYVCESCGSHFTNWAGRCSVCGEWNTIVEEQQDQVVLGRGGGAASADPTELTLLKDLPASQAKRIKSGLKEFDRVLGGDDPGLVEGSVILLAGNPGIGKSTLLLQVASTVAGTIYFSAEESLEQLRIRATRLGLVKNDLRIAAERNLNRLIATIKQEQPKFVVIDSVQTIFDDTIAGTPGSLTQVRENCWRLQQFAKQTGVAILLVGHVTKEGVVAGPKVLEHLVDVVMYLEGEKRTGLRILRCDKNRYGSTEEVGIWQLESSGFVTVDDPGKLFASLLSEDIPGRSLTVALEGTRAFLVEIQALVTKTAFGYPKRTSQGIDTNRLNILLAVLENRLELPLSQYDVYVNVVGGFSVKDPGIDLAVAAAIISGLSKKPLPDKLVLVGEVGLLGEIRPAYEAARRKKEAARLNYRFSPKLTTIRSLPSVFSSKEQSE